MKFGNPRPYAAETLATFTLTLGVSLSLLFPVPLATPVIAALIVTAFVYTIGAVSGAHINPAVTLGMWAISKIETKDALLYMAAQLIGAGIAALIVLSMTAMIPLTGGEESLQILFGEAIGAFILVFGVAAVASKNVHAGATGIVVGVSLLAGILLAAPLSAGIINPAVAFGLGSVSFSYLLGPLLGGTLGAMVYNWIHGR